MVQFIPQAIAFQLFFLIIYDVFLKKETFFHWNRGYLLGTAILSFILPFIKIERFKYMISQEYIITLPEVLIGKQNPIVLDEILIEGSNQIAVFSWSWIYLLYLGWAIAFIVFTYKLIKIFQLIYSNPKHKESHLKIVNLENSRDAFSFFNYIFIGKQLGDQERETILKHELVHVQQKHSFDMLFFEVFRILFWFNPFIYMYQNRISVVHEFLADAEAVKHNKTQYYQNLLSQAFNANQVSFINPFFKESLIKKRIVMLQKSKSKQVQLFRYALLIPMVFGMLIYSSCSDTSQDNINEKELSQQDELKMIIKSLDTSGKLNNSDTEALSAYILGAIKTNIEGQNALIKPIDTSQDTNKDEVAYSVIDQVPVFPGCENGSSNEEKKTCTNEKISVSVAKNFKTHLAESLGLKGTMKISIFFKIDTHGHIIEVEAKAPHPELEKEAIRVVNMLPKMTPGIHDGKTVTVLYYLPIKFVIQ